MLIPNIKEASPRTDYNDHASIKDLLTKFRYTQMKVGLIMIQATLIIEAITVLTAPLRLQDVHHLISKIITQVNTESKCQLKLTIMMMKQ